jgi:hypothetical protein
MIKINKPAIAAKIYLKYNGSRLDLMQKYSAFLNSRIEFEKIFENVKETITIKVKLFDNKIYYLGLISRNIYTEINNNLVKFENGFLMHNSIMLSNNLTFIQGVITMDLEINGEFINERYLFKVFINGTNQIHKYILDSEIECENFVKE